MSIPEGEQPGELRLTALGATWLFEARTMSSRYAVRRYVPTAQLGEALELLLERQWEEFKRRYAEQPSGEAALTEQELEDEMLAKGNDIVYGNHKKGTII